MRPVGSGMAPPSPPFAEAPALATFPSARLGLTPACGPVAGLPGLPGPTHRSPRCQVSWPVHSVLENAVHSQVGQVPSWTLEVVQVTSVLFY